MGVLDQVMQLKGQGMGDEEIVSNLQQQGISPKEINDAMNQAQIKNAVSSEPAPEYEAPSPAGAGGGEAVYTPATQEVGAEYGGETAAGQEYYPEAGYAAPAAAMDSDTIIEIANQVFAEKIKKTEKSLDELNELKTLAQVKIENIDERLKKIERVIDTIQIKILEKVGSYGEELKSTKKEMAMMQDTFKKVGKKRSVSKKGR
jgi:hypothetical protein